MYILHHSLKKVSNATLMTVEWKISIYNTVWSQVINRPYNLQSAGSKLALVFWKKPLGITGTYDKI